MKKFITKKKIINLIVSLAMYSIIWWLIVEYGDKSIILPDGTENISFCRKVCIFCLIGIFVLVVAGIIFKYFMTKQLFKDTGLFLAAIPILLFWHQFVLLSLFELPNELKWSFISKDFIRSDTFAIAVLLMFAFAFMVSSFYRGIRFLQVGDEVKIPKFFNIILYFNNPNKKTKFSVVYQSLMAIYFLLLFVAFLMRQNFRINFITAYLLLILTFEIVYFTKKHDLI